MATSNKIQVANLLVRVQGTEKQVDGSLTLSVTYLVSQETQRAKITIPAGKGISRHVAYRAAVDLYHKRILKGTEYRATGIITNSIYRITKGGKEQTGLSTRMVVDKFVMEEPEAIDEELASIPIKVYEQEEAEKDKTAEKVVAALRQKRVASGAAKTVASSSRAEALTRVPPSETSESDEEVLTRRSRAGASAAISPLTPKPQESNVLEDITNIGAAAKKKGPGRPRKRKTVIKPPEDHHNSGDDQGNGPANTNESVEQLSD